MKNEEKYYLHFSNKYKDAVVELDKQYREHYSYVMQIQQDIAILKADIVMLRKELIEVKENAVGLFDGSNRKNR